MLSFVVTSHSRCHPALRGVVDHFVEQCGTRARAPVGRDEDDELGVAVDLVPQRAADRAAVVFDDETVE